MPDFRIYYDGGAVYDSDPFNAPAWGVLVIVERNKDCGRILHTTKDYFVWLGSGWLSVDFVGMLDYLAQPGAKKVLFGRVIIADPWTGTIGKLSEEYPKQVIRYGSYRRAA